MLKMPKYCKKYTQKCPYCSWGIGGIVDEVLDNNLHPPFTTQPTTSQDDEYEQFRARQMNPCCVKHQREILWYLGDLFENNKITYWLDFGTLLGAVREGRSIPHDTDGDMCLFLVDREKVLSLAPQAKKDGFLINFIKPVNATDTHIKVCRSKKNFMIVDLFFWIHDDIAGVYRGDGLNLPKSFPDWWIEELSQVSIFDKKMWAPREPEKFLRMRFGKDWRKPQNKKVHHGDAIEAHRYGFEYAASKGWLNNRKRKV